MEDTIEKGKWVGSFPRGLFGFGVVSIKGNKNMNGGIDLNEQGKGCVGFPVNIIIYPYLIAVLGKNKPYLIIGLGEIIGEWIASIMESFQASELVIHCYNNNTMDIKIQSSAVVIEQNKFLDIELAEDGSKPINER